VCAGKASANREEPGAGAHRQESTSTDSIRRGGGYRPRRSAQDAIQKVHEWLCAGYTDVVDADLSKYFDTIPHAELMQCVARRMVDRRVLHLIKMWLTSPVAEGDGKGSWRCTGSSGKGTPQGGVISPLLANPYMNRFLKYWRLQGKGQQYRAKIVAYADDFVILSRGCAEQARECAQAVMTRIGLTLNEQKTRICDARTQDFNFPGYTFGPRWWWKTGRPYTAARPSEKSLKRLRQSVHNLLRPSLCAPWEEVRDPLNAKLVGWHNYFRYGTVAKAYQAVNLYVYDRVRHFLRRRHKATSSKGSEQFPITAVFGRLGVHRMSTARRRAACAAHEVRRKAGCGKSARPV